MNIRHHLPYISREYKFNKAIYRQHKLYAGCRFSRKIAYFIHYYIYYKWHCDISLKSEIDKAVAFPHPIGIVIGDGVKIGSKTIIYQNVTIGQKGNEYPQIGNNCIIYPNSVIIGNIKISDGSIIGAGSVVLVSTEPNSIYAGNPAKRISP